MEKYIFWFRNDLRIADNPGLLHATMLGDVIPIYIDEKANETIETESSKWLKKSLQCLNDSLNGCLNFYSGNATDIIKNIITNHKIDGVFWNKRYQIEEISIDNSVKNLLLNSGIEFEDFCANALVEPWDINNLSGTFYKLFTPFFKNICQKSFREPLHLPSHNNFIKINSEEIPKIQNESQKFMAGEFLALKKLDNFIKNGLIGYEKFRDYPAMNNTSMLSAHLHFGEISPYQILNKLKLQATEITLEDVNCFFKELCWREFSIYQNFHNPQLSQKNINSNFDKFEWENSEQKFEAWKNGKTGYPFIDAGMRQLLKTGYMHNRVRMLAASFLVKNLLIDWRFGESWFLEKLTDADLALNSFNWQWIAGSGSDSMPYYRIFNPVLQAKKFDPNAIYIKKFVPELKNLSEKIILNNINTQNHSDYPKFIIDIKISSKEALSRYKKIISE